jgi:predicted nucleic acid-binding Zn ribbon protein
MAFTTVRGVVEKILKKYKLNGDIDAYRVFQVWSDLVGDRIAAHARPARIDGYFLYVEVDDPLWLTQLKYMKIDILGKIDVMIKKDVLRDVRFYLKSSVE